MTPFSPAHNTVLLPILETPSRGTIPDVDEAGARLLKLLADGTRRRIFLALMAGETCNCELAERMGIAQNLISHHVRQLKDAGLVRERRDTADARWIYYTVDGDALDRAWVALAATISPAALRRRTPDCGPPLPIP